METTTEATDSQKPEAFGEQEISLRALRKGLPDDTVIDAQVPEVRATTQDRFTNFDLFTISHVVIQVSISRQQDIFRYVGYHYDWNFPGPYWYFLGKIAAKALYNDGAKLDVLNYVPLVRQEFIAYTTPTWAAAVKAKEAKGVTELTPVNVVELNFKKPVPNEPLEISWAPARKLIISHIRRWHEDSDEEDMLEDSD
ncbi:hypothetical protein C7999DRAFT_34076 [Corynascus novoguineensis]|uniref:Uncharacterized protein n=1 Tax=Corynascus novoguineensis TaxID=1126955 RepID=A0AAN7CNZ4_9PEZI|nr:hypothetical protein C7999DRAFT_34076 [Corynascus novoguineensis]